MGLQQQDKEEKKRLDGKKTLAGDRYSLYMCIYVSLYTAISLSVCACVCVCFSSPQEKFAFAAEVSLKALLISSHNTDGGRH